MTQQVHYANSFKYQATWKPEPENSCKLSPPAQGFHPLKMGCNSLLNSK